MPLRRMIWSGVLKAFFSDPELKALRRISDLRDAFAHANLKKLKRYLHGEEKLSVFEMHEHARELDVPKIILECVNFSRCLHPIWKRLAAS